MIHRRLYPDLLAILENSRAGQRVKSGYFAGKQRTENPFTEYMPMLSLPLVVNFPLVLYERHVLL